MRKPGLVPVLYRHSTPALSDRQRIGPMSTCRPYASVVHRSEVLTQRGPMSPRHEPIDVLLFERLIVAGSQSRSQLAGFGRSFGQVFLRTRHWTNAGPNVPAGAPMQLMLPDGDWKWTSDPNA